FTSDAGFLVAIAGGLALYGELIWPGRVIPGLVGATLLASGGYILCQNSPSLPGLALIGLSIILFATEALANARFVAGIGGTIALSAGALLLFRGGTRIDAPAAYLLSAVFGATTTVLGHEAGRARRNKRADVTEET